MRKSGLWLKLIILTLGFGLALVLYSAPSAFTQGNGNKRDVIMEHPSNGVLQVWQVNRTSITSTNALGAITNSQWRIVGSMDFDMDNNLDLLWQNSASGEFRVWYLKGSTKVAEAPLELDLDNPEMNICAIGDINRDGFDDLICQNADDVEFLFLEGSNVTSRVSLENVLDSPSVKIQACGDFNNDSELELLTIDSATLEVELLSMDQNQIVNSTSVVPASTWTAKWQVIGCADFNGDGTDDILFQHADTHEFQVWLMQAGQVHGITSLNPAVAVDNAFKAIATIHLNRIPGVVLTLPPDHALYSEPAQVNLAATASDSDGVVTNLIFKTNAHVISGDDTAPYHANWSNVKAGTYAVEASAIDNSGGTNTSRKINLTVNAVPEVRLTSPKANSIFEAPARIVLEALASDKEGGVKKVEFYCGSKLLSSDTSSPYRFAWSNVKSGNYLFHAKAIDKDLSSGTSQVVGVKVNSLALEDTVWILDGPNSPPSVIITNPVSGSIFPRNPSDIVIDAVAGDTDGFINRVEFYSGSNLILTDHSAPYGMTWSLVAQGTYTLTAKAYDNLEASTTSSQVKVYVGPVHVFRSPGNYPLSVVCNSTTDMSGEIWGGGGAGGGSQDVNGNGGGGGAYSKRTWQLSVTNHPLETIVGSGGIYPNSGQASRFNFTNSATAYNLLANGGEVGGTSEDSGGAGGTATGGTTNTSGVDGNVYGEGGASPNGGAGGGFDADGSAPGGGGGCGPICSAGCIPANPGHPGGNGQAAIKLIPGIGSSPTIQITSPTAGAVFAENTNIVIEASASEPYGMISKVEFYKDAVLIGSDTTSPYSFTWNSVARAVYSLTAKAIDNANEMTTSSAVSITVSAVPTVSITSPVSGANFRIPTDVPISAAASDVDGSIAEVNFYQGSTLITTDESNPYAITWQDVDVGEYSLKAVAVDNLGLATISSLVGITVNGEDYNFPPQVTLTSPANGSVFVSLADVLLTADANDVDGGIQKVQFLINKPGTIISKEDYSSPFEGQWIDAESGNYVITAIATDDKGETTESAPIRVFIGPQIIFDTPGNYQLVMNVEGLLQVTSEVWGGGGGGGGSQDLRGGGGGGGGYSSRSWQLAVTNHTFEAIVGAGGNQAVGQTSRFNFTNNATAFNLLANGGGLGEDCPDLVGGTGGTATGGTTNISGEDGNSLDEGRGGSSHNGGVGGAPENPGQAPGGGGGCGPTCSAGCIPANPGHPGANGRVKITLVSLVNLPPTIDLVTPTDGSIFSEGNNVVFEATASDADGSIAGIDFFQGTSLVGTDNSAPYSYTWLSVAAGNYSLIARARDNLGEASFSSRVGIEVRPSLSVVLTSPGENQLYEVSSTIVLNAAVNGGSGGIEKVEFFYNGSNLLSQDLTAPYSYTWNSVVIGNYSLTAKVTDMVGATRTSAPRTIRVNNREVDLTPTADTFVRGGTYANTVYGASTVLETRQSASNGSDRRWAYFKFDIRNVQGYATQAYLKLYGAHRKDSAPVPTRCCAVPETNWSENLVNWNNKPAVGDFLSEISVGNVEGWWSWDVTNYIKAAQDKGHSFVSLMISNSINTGLLTFNSREYPSALNVPILNIVAVENNFPTASITSPANNSVFGAHTNITIAVNAQDTGGAISKVDFYADGKLLGSDTSAPYTQEWTNLIAGKWQLTATATDNLGSKVTTTPVDVTVELPESASTILWLKADSTNATHDVPIEYWYDSAGTSHASQSDQAKRPKFITNGVSGSPPINVKSIKFDGTTQFLNLPSGFSNFSNGLTAFVVTKPTSTGDHIRFLEFGTSGNENIIRLTRAPLLSSSTTFSRVEFHEKWDGWASHYKIGKENGILQNQYQVFEMVHNPSREMHLYRNGSSQDYLLWDSATPRHLPNVVRNLNYIGASGNVSAKFKGEIAEIILFKKTLPEISRQNVEQYLGKKYALAINIPPIVSITSPSDNTLLHNANSLIIQTEASDANGQLTSVDLYHGTTLISADTQAPYTTTWNNVAFGTYSLVAYAYDNGRAYTASKPVNVTFNQTPAVSITSPANGAMFSAFNTIPITVTATDNDGTIQLVEFYSGSTLIGSDGTPPYSMSWTEVGIGTYGLTAKAIDDRFGSTTSAAVNVTVHIPSPDKLKLWLKANSIAGLTDGGAIGTWQDSSDAGNTAVQATASYKPTYKVDVINGLPVARFDGTDDFISATFSGGTNSFTILAVTKPTMAHEIDTESTSGSAGDSGQKYLFGPTTATGTAAGAGISLGNNGLSVYESGASYNPALAVYQQTLSSFHVYAVEYKAKQPIISRNDFNVRTGLLSPKDNVYAPLHIGGSSTLGCFQGDVAEVLVYDTGLPELDLQAAEKYLGHKYNISINPPPTVSITAPANGATHTVPSILTISANASDADGIGSVEFYSDSTLISTDLTSPYSIVWTNEVAGTFSLTAIARDAGGAITVSSPINAVGNFPQASALKLWLKADSLAGHVNNQLVETWNDMSGNANDCTASGVNRPTYKTNRINSKPAVFFDGTDDIVKDLTFSPATAAELTVFIVGAPASNAGSNKGIFSSRATSGADSITGLRMDLGVNSTTAFNFLNVDGAKGIGESDLKTSSHSFNVFNALTLKYHSSAVQLLVNGFKEGARQGSTGTVNLAEVRVGARFGTFQFGYFHGDIAEVIVFNTALSQSDQQIIERSLGVKYNLSVNSPPSVSITYPSEDSAFVPGSDVVIRAIATDTQNALTKVEFYQGATLLDTDYGSPWSTTWTAVSSGTYSLTAKAFDKEDYVTTSNPVRIHLNNKPQLSLVCPVHGTNLIAPGSIQLEATASDSNDSVARVEFYQGTSLISAVTSNPYRYQWNSIGAGTYDISAIVVDSLGLSASSETAQMIVYSNPSISITAPLNNSAYLALANVPLTTTVSGGANPIDEVYFYSNSTNHIGTATSINSTFSTTWLNVVAGTYSLTAKAKDKLGLNVTSSPVNTTVVNGPKVTLTAPSDETQLTAPASIAMSATAVVGDYSIAEVEFYHDTTLLNEDQSAPYQYTWTSVGAGTYKLTAKAIDSQGWSSFSDPISVRVISQSLDTDGDGMPDWWETLYGLDPNNAADATGDLDGDGVNNLTEYKLGRNPTKATAPDTNGLLNLQVYPVFE